MQSLKQSVGMAARNNTQNKVKLIVVSITDRTIACWYSCVKASWCSLQVTYCRFLSVRILTANNKKHNSPTEDGIIIHSNKPKTIYLKGLFFKHFEMVS